MKRKIGAVLFGTVLILLFAGCGRSGEQETETDVISEGTDVILDSNTDLIEYSQVPEPDVDPDPEMPRELQTMILPMDALNIMLAETDCVYQASDPLSYWTAIDYTVGNHGYIHPGVEQVGGSYKLSGDMVQVFADALFAEGGNIQDIPIPEALSEQITYDRKEDSYLFTLGDRGMSEYELYEYRENQDGSYDITLKLYSIEDESTICTGIYHIVPDEVMTDHENAVFYYRIQSAKVESELGH